MDPALSQFQKEIRHFSRISVFNLSFAGIAIAFGLTYLIATVFGLTLDPMMTRFPVLSGGVAMISLGLGIGWLLTTARVFEGIVNIGHQLEREGETITGERLTCLIVRMFAHYRDNRRIIRMMILVSMLYGCGFLIIGISMCLEFTGILRTGAILSLTSYLHIPSLLVMFGIATVSLLSSYYFSEITKVWDRRLHGIDKSECALKKTLGLDDQ